MAFFPPLPLIRKNVIIKKLRACGATSEESAKTLAEAGCGHGRLRAGRGSGCCSVAAERSAGNGRSFRTE